MVGQLSLTLFLTACCIPVLAVADTAAKRAADRPHAVPAGSQALVAAVNSVVATDIGIPSADVALCSLTALPSSRAKILPLLPPEHRRLIAECARGRTRLRRHPRGFNLLVLLEPVLLEPVLLEPVLLEDPVEATADTTAIQAFFDERSVDVAIGSGSSAGPYPISFDWVVVLDAEADTIFSFIVNCQD